MRSYVFIFALVVLTGDLHAIFGPLGTGGPLAHAQSVDPETLDALEQERVIANQNAIRLETERKALRKDIERLKSSLKKTTDETNRIEREGLAIASRLQSLNSEAEAHRKEVYKNREALINLIGVLQRAEAKPPPAILGSTQDTIDHIQTSHLVSGVTQGLKQRSDRLAFQLDTLQKTEKKAQGEKQKLDVNERKLAAKRMQIRGLVSSKSDLERTVSTQSVRERNRAQKLAKEAGSLRDLISRFESLARDVSPRLKPPKSSAASPRASRSNSARSTRLRNRPVVLPPDTKRFSDARNSLRAPVAGTLIKNYGKGNKGMTVKARKNAQVISPYAGRVEFSGPFKNYENVVIINVGGDYFILMTGLGEVYAETGDDIVTGAALGIMPAGPSPTAELYIEFRKNGAPIDPKPWLGTAFAQR